MNALGRWQGQTDSPLSDAGRAQARRLGARLGAAGFPRFGRLVTSDLARAAQTADAVGEALGLAPVPESGLRELDVGAWGGCTPAEIAERWPAEHTRFRAGDDHVRPGGGESRARLRGRALAALGRHAAGEGPLLVVSHLGVLRALRPGIRLANAEGYWWHAAASVSPDPGETL